MSSGSLFQVADESRDEFAACESKSCWFQTLAELHRRCGLAQSCVGDTIDAWREIVENEDGGLRNLFYGELSTVDLQEESDPSVVFAGKAVVAQASIELSAISAESLSEWLESHGYSPEPEVCARLPDLKLFLANAAANQSAIVILWY